MRLSTVEALKRGGIPIPKVYIVPKLDAQGRHFREIDTILLNKKTGQTPAVLGHELGHHFLHHGNAKSAQELVRTEIEAWIFTYNLRGKPRGLKETFIGIINEAAEDFRTKPSRTYKLLHEELVLQKAPKSWLVSLRRIKPMIRKVEG